MPKKKSDKKKEGAATESVVAATKNKKASARAKSAVEAKVVPRKKPEPASKPIEPKAAQPALAGNAGRVVKKVVERAPKEVVIPIEEISLRAYFISEKRQSQGIPGDETGDWVQAERELREELTRKARRKAGG